MIGRQIPQEIFKRNPSQTLSGTTVHTPSISDSDASRRNRLVSRARLERLQEEKLRVAKAHKDTLDRLIELDTNAEFSKQRLIRHKLSSLKRKKPPPTGPSLPVSNPHANKMS